MRSIATARQPRILSLLFTVAAIIVSAMTILAFSQLNGKQQAGAVSGSDFQAGRIIDDVVFYNRSAMDASQIQNFLNYQVPTCDTWGSQRAWDFRRGDITRAEYAALRGWHAPPYTCLKDFKQDTPQMEAASGLCSAMSAGSNRSAAQIVYDVAQACNINPQVLIVLLEKEQSLVRDTWPLNGQYRSATGFACPDTAPCNPAYNGFFYQVYHAARQFQVYKKYPNSYNYIAGRVNNIYYNPDLGRCGSAPVYIQNQATAALYIYTPYQPNAAALNDLYGEGDSCSAHGNRNFWRLFSDWFGSTHGVLPEFTSRYEALGGGGGLLGAVTDAGYCSNDRSICWQSFARGSIVYSASTGAWESTGYIRTFWASIGYQTGRAGFPTGSEMYDSGTRTWSQTYQYGTIYYSDALGGRFVSKEVSDYWLSTGGYRGPLLSPVGSTAGNLNSFAWQEYQNGFVVGNNSTGFFMSKGAIRTFWASIGYQTGKAGLPISSELYDAGSKTWYQAYQHGTIYYSDALGGRFVAKQVNDYWVSVGGFGSVLKSPKHSTTGTLHHFAWQEYQDGFVVGNTANGFFMSKGAIRTFWASIGYQTGRAGFPTGSEMYDSGTRTWSQTYQYGTIYYSDALGGRFVAR